MPVTRHVAPRALGGSAYETYTKTESTSADEFGRPNVNPPTIVIQDNLTLYSFTLNTDRATIKFPIPSDLYSGGIDLAVLWTNDGGTDDNDKTVKWQIDYQVGKEGDDVDGSHANSPKQVQDTYESSEGWVEHHASYVTIGAADIADMECIFIKISAITPTGTQLTSEPHLIGICKRYTARRVVLS